MILVSVLVAGDAPSVAGLPNCCAVAYQIVMVVPSNFVSVKLASSL